MNFGVERKYSDRLSFDIKSKIPKFKNEKVVYFEKDQIKNFFNAVDEYEEQEIDFGTAVKTIHLFALYTGIRKTAVLSLRLDDINFTHKIIHLRKGKGRSEGEVDKVPMNKSAEKVICAWLRKRKCDKSNPYIFSGRDGTGRRKCIDRAWRKIREMANYRAILGFTTCAMCLHQRSFPMV